MTGILKIISMVLTLSTKVIERINKKEVQEGTIAKMEVDKLREANNALKASINMRNIARHDFDKHGMPDDYKHYRK